MVRVECRAVGDLVRIEVQDTGIGIPLDQMDDIWTEFHQVGNPERDRNKGLGLAIVQRLAKLLGRRVEVLSALGRGSVFSIEVPIGSAVATTKQAPEPIASLADGRYAVLVDDDAIVLLGLQSIRTTGGTRCWRQARPNRRWNACAPTPASPTSSSPITACAAAGSARKRS